MKNRYNEKVAEILINIESVKFSFDNPFTLTSGLKSPVYVDCRKIISFVNERQTIINYGIEYFKEKQKTILIEDLATDGGSKIIFIDAIRKAKLKITDIFVIFYYDIFDFKKSSLSNYQVNLHSLCTWKDIIDIIKIKKLYSTKQINSLENFLYDPEKWRKEI